MNTRDEVMAVLQQILGRKHRELGPVGDDVSLFHDGIGLDSFDLAELSVNLELRLGKDPFTSGRMVRTLGELLAFYEPHGSSS